MAVVKLGQTAPDFTVKTNTGQEVRLADYRGKKNIVLVLYPGDQTADCSRMLCAFRDEFPRFNDTDTLVFGVNPANADSHQRFVDRLGLPFELIVDEGREVARRYDALMLMGYVVKRTVIAINKEGKVVFYERGYPSNDSILAALKGN
ncbi:MAG: peroxiredoxin [Chloroflexi bacterium]|nr:peroxiredoxin [Chloroflexota bacterium]